MDFPLLAAALAGQDADVTLEQVLHTCATAIKQLAKTGYMRARKAQVTAEFVNYAEVLRASGMRCGICGQPIVRPLGLQPDALAFDYIVALGQGGSHTGQNLHPVHVDCATPKNAGATPVQFSYGKKTDLSYRKETSCLTVRNPVVLPPADRFSYGKTTLPYRTKITSEITTEITSSSVQARAPAPTATKQLQALYCVLTGNAWRAQDEEIAADFREADPRKIELALLETLLETKQPHIHAFKYFVPRLQLWLAVELMDVTIDTLLAMRRHRWQQQQVSGVRC